MLSEWWTIPLEYPEMFEKLFDDPSNYCNQPLSIRLLNDQKANDTDELPNCKDTIRVVWTREQKLIVVIFSMIISHVRAWERQSSIEKVKTFFLVDDWYRIIENNDICRHFSNLFNEQQCPRTIRKLVYSLNFLINDFVHEVNLSLVIWNQRHVSLVHHTLRNDVLIHSNTLDVNLDGLYSPENIVFRFENLEAIMNIFERTKVGVKRDDDNRTSINIDHFNCHNSLIQITNPWQKIDLWLFEKVVRPIMVASSSSDLLDAYNYYSSISCTSFDNYSIPCPTLHTDPVNCTISDDNNKTITTWKRLQTNPFVRDVMGKKQKSLQERMQELNLSTITCKEPVYYYDNPHEQVFQSKEPIHIQFENGIVKNIIGLGEREELTLVVWDDPFHTELGWT